MMPCCQPPEEVGSFFFFPFFSLPLPKTYLREHVIREEIRAVGILFVPHLLVLLFYGYVTSLQRRWRHTRFLGFCPGCAPHTHLFVSALVHGLKLDTGPGPTYRSIRFPHVLAKLIVRLVQAAQIAAQFGAKGGRVLHANHAGICGIHLFSSVHLTVDQALLLFRKRMYRLPLASHLAAVSEASTPRSAGANGSHTPLEPRQQIT